MSLAILFHSVCAQHVSNVNISIIRSLWLFLLNYRIGRILLGSMCVELRCGRVEVVSALQAEEQLQPATRIPLQPDHTVTQHTSNQEEYDRCGNSTEKVASSWWWIILTFETCWAHKKWNKIASDIKLVFHSSTNCYLSFVQCLEKKSHFFVASLPLTDFILVLGTVSRFVKKDIHVNKFRFGCMYLNMKNVLSCLQYSLYQQKLSWCVFIVNWLRSMFVRTAYTIY